MTGKLTKIYFVHEGKAAYPEIAAYRHFFEGVYASEDIAPEALAKRADLAGAICWHMMGFYRHRPAGAGLVVHDYRSLSVGRLWRAKDWVKRHFNARPDVRIFQNAEMQDLMSFADDVPCILLPMGVPPEVVDLRAAPRPAPSFDFCYIGAMSAERRTSEMLDSFVRRYGDRKTFHLYGLPEKGLSERYKAHANIRFAGRKEQKELFEEIRKARVAVNYFPDHFPHRLQTPTKFLEYAALGLRILSNEQSQSRLAAQRYGIQSLWGPARDMFADAPDVLDWPDNAALDPSPLLWPSVIAQSGVASALEKAGKP